MNKTPIQILQEAKELLQRPGGWCQGGYGTPESCCALGAINLAGYGVLRSSQAQPSTAEAQATHLAIRTFEDSLPAGNHTIGPWNDAADRTLDDVLRTFDKAISKLNAQGGDQ